MDTCVTNDRIAERYLKKIKNVFGEEVNANPRLASMDNPWDHWQEMPEYNPFGTQFFAEFELQFESEKAVQNFMNLSGLELTPKATDIWYPPRKSANYNKTHGYYCKNTEETMPKYPIYIVSKGRWEKRPTSTQLCMMGIPHYIVVEESQYQSYLAAVDQKYVTVLILDQSYLDNYDTFDDLGYTKSKGPGAARNFAWEHSISIGAERHWVMDDNINGFYRLNEDKRWITYAASFWRAMEEHTDRYSNVVMSGPHYKFFSIPQLQNPPFTQNTRVYSCNLIRNDIPFRWRGRYNEDTDLSIRILKANLATLQYNGFLQSKMATQAMKGGNTTEFYAKEGTLPKSQMLVDMHPDVAVLKWMNQRWHHYVDYSVYKQIRLEYKPGVLESLSCVPNEYGMEILPHGDYK